MPIHTIKLLARETVANNTIKLSFEKPEGFKHVAGQYGGFTLIDPPETDDHGNTRRFSLLCSPDDENLMLVTRIQKSAYKRNLKNMPIGHEIKFAGPTGKFVLNDEKNLPVVLIAGGIGIAPFYSMIIDALKHQPDRQITLFYGNQTLADSAFMQELQKLAQEHAQFKLIATLSDPHPDWEGEKGFISDEMIVKNVRDLDKPTFYVCGSLTMVTALQQTLVELQISDDRIMIEDFPGY